MIILPSLISTVIPMTTRGLMTGSGWSTKLIKLGWMIGGTIIVTPPVTIPVSRTSATRVWRRCP